ncbi:hypothetical protein ACO0LC_10610 [Undibacterium sp. JH2W]|uniref:hypothetical protein n=1 Tax=Undibacterium sp. JH2W TaxID=3413037 RepID=UPI003BF296FD
MADTLHPAPVNGMPAEQEPSQAQLQLKTSITPAFMQALEVELQQILHGRFMALRQRMMPANTVARLRTVVKYLSLLGLSLCLLMFVMGGMLFHGVRVDAAFTVFFLGMLVLHWDKNKRPTWSEKLFMPYWNWLAKNSTNRMLKIAKASAPFSAEYHFQGNTASYHRVSSTGSMQAWKREIRHVYLPGQRISLLFKKPSSIYPYAIILHEQPQELAAYLEGLGLGRIG